MSGITYEALYAGNLRHLDNWQRLWKQHQALRQAVEEFLAGGTKEALMKALRRDDDVRAIC